MSLVRARSEKAWAPTVPITPRIDCFFHLIVDDFTFYPIETPKWPTVSNPYIFVSEAREVDS